MLYVRTTKTTSSAIAVQVVKYTNRKMHILAHIGSTHNKEELQSLKISALKWIERISRQQPLFSSTKNKSTNLISLKKCQYLGIRYHFVYEMISQIFNKLKFHQLDKMLTDLVLIRIVEPASKLRSIELLNAFFGIKYLRKNFYQKLPQFISLKNKVETKVLKLAQKELNFDFSLVFYDVTTLYFETFQSDELRKTGFSKDNKPQQPQILIGLIVNSEGFPIAYDVFQGNTFEGHTFIPVISDFKRKHHIKKLTVVADAAMISLDNIQALQASKLHYIVGARIKNLSKKLINKISEKLSKQDKATIRIETEYGNLVCGFSLKRYQKDKFEMEKQLKKAKDLLKTPVKVKRTKFLKNKGKSNFQLNEKLIEKTTKLLGIKGYSDVTLNSTKNTLKFN